MGHALSNKKKGGLRDVDWTRDYGFSASSSSSSFFLVFQKEKSGPGRGDSGGAGLVKTQLN